MTENAHSTHSRAPRVLVVGDIGQHTYHVGDEAMTIASAQALAEGGAEVTLMTRDERHSARYLNASRGAEGDGYSYLPFFLFPWAPAERELTLAALECVLTELHADRERPSIAELVALPQVQALPEVLHPLEQTVERMVGFADSIAAMDAVVISGGGNLNSRFGWLLYERASVALVAEYAGVPLFVTGQSLGPVLNPEDAQVLERMLRTARSVTVRESSSLAWCRERDIDARLSVDDATDYPVASPARTLHYAEGISASQALNELPEHYVCVTVNECTDQQAQQIARLLDGMWREHGYAPVFLSHYGDPQDPTSGDIQAHQRIAERLSPSHPGDPATDSARRPERRSAPCGGVHADQPLPPGGLLGRGRYSGARADSRCVHADAGGRRAEPVRAGRVHPAVGYACRRCSRADGRHRPATCGGGIGCAPRRTAGGATSRTCLPADADSCAR